MRGRRAAGRLLLEPSAHWDEGPFALAGVDIGAVSGPARTPSPGGYAESSTTSALTSATA